jgi:hypothetical protein
MSLQIVLSHYLSHLRERDELDALWPDVIKAMGHDVRSRPQIGPNQAGVDIVSVGPDDDGAQTVYLWILKFGDIGRADFYSGEQCIEASVRQAYTNFIPNRLTPEERALPIRIVILSNGSMKQEVRADYAGLSKNVAEHPGATLDFWGMDKITPLIEEHVFDETLLLGKGKADLRAAVAAFEDTEEVVRRFVRFTNDCLAGQPDDVQVAEATRFKRFLKRCAAACMGHAVVVVLGREENNLKPAVIAGEYLALRVWAEAVTLGVATKPAFQRRFAAAMEVHQGAALNYLEKILPALMSPTTIARYRRNVVFYADLVFEEIGRLATTLLWMHHQNAPKDLRDDHLRILITLFERHSIATRPVLDGQSVDLSLAFAALLAHGQHTVLKRILQSALGALIVCLRRGLPLPIDTDLLEDAITVHVTGEAEPRQFFETTTLVPLLATLAGLVDDVDALGKLHALRSDLGEVTLERWQPSAGLETYSGSDIDFRELGVSRTLDALGATPADERAAAERVEDAAAPRDGFVWGGSPWEGLLATSARLHRHPLPSWYLAAVATSPAAETEIPSAAPLPDDNDA